MYCISWVSKCRWPSFPYIPVWCQHVQLQSWVQSLQRIFLRFQLHKTRKKTSPQMPFTHEPWGYLLKPCARIRAMVTRSPIEVVQHKNNFPTEVVLPPATCSVGDHQTYQTPPEREVNILQPANLCMLSILEVHFAGFLRLSSDTLTCTNRGPKKYPLEIISGWWCQFWEQQPLEETLHICPTCGWSHPG